MLNFAKLGLVAHVCGCFTTTQWCQRETTFNNVHYDFNVINIVC